MLREVAWRLLPSYMGERAHRHRLGLVAGTSADAWAFLEANDQRVQGGPFKGMRYLPPPRVAHLSRLKGEYEREIHPWIERLRAEFPTEHFIDIGAEDGYYAVGFARMGLRVDAFELSATAREQIAGLAKTNKTLVHLHGRATGRRIRRLKPSRAFVLCDIEGAEADVLDRKTVRALRDSAVIVEIHEQMRPGVEGLLRKMFEGTHTCERVEPRGDSYHRADATPWLLFTPTA